MNIIRAAESVVHQSSGMLDDYSINLLTVFICGAFFIMALMWVTTWFEKNVNMDGFIVIMVLSGVVMVRLYFYVGAPIDIRLF